MKLFILRLFCLSCLLFLISNANANGTPVEKKSLVFTVPNNFNRIQPGEITNAQTKLLLPLVYETLVKINDKQQIVPGVAKSWKIDLQNRIIQFEIANNHFFSNGMLLTTNDVLFSIKKLCNKGGRVAKELVGLKGCNDKTIKSPSVNVVGKNRIQLGFNGNPSIFLHQLASPVSGILKQINQKAFGSGPYVINKLHKNGRYLSLALNKYFHNKKQIANSGIVIKMLYEEGFDKGIATTKPDGSLMYRSSSIKKISDPDYRIVDDVAFITQTLVLNNKKYPFNKKIIRKAILADLYNNGHLERCIEGGKKAYGLIPYGLGGSIANQLNPKVDIISPEVVFSKLPELKRKHIEVKIHQHVSRKNSCESEALVHSAEKFNIIVKMVYHDDYQTLLPLYFNHQLDGFVELFVFLNREAYGGLLYFDPSDDNNFANIRNYEIKLYLNDALENFSARKRFLAYQKISKSLNENAHVIPYYYIGSSALISKCLGGVVKEFYFNPFEHLKSVYRKKGCRLQSKKNYFY